MSVYRTDPGPAKYECEHAIVLGVRTGAVHDWKGLQEDVRAEFLSKHRSSDGGEEMGFRFVVEQGYVTFGG